MPTKKKRPDPEKIERQQARDFKGALSIMEKKYRKALKEGHLLPEAMTLLENRIACLQAIREHLKTPQDYFIGYLLWILGSHFEDDIASMIRRSRTTKAGKESGERRRREMRSVASELAAEVDDLKARNPRLSDTAAVGRVMGRMALENPGEKLPSLSRARQLYRIAKEDE